MWGLVVCVGRHTGPQAVDLGPVSAPKTLYRQNCRTIPTMIVFGGLITPTCLNSFTLLNVPVPFFPSADFYPPFISPPPLTTTTSFHCLTHSTPTASCSCTCSSATTTHPLLAPSPCRGNKCLPIPAATQHCLRLDPRPRVTLGNSVPIPCPGFLFRGFGLC